MKPQLDKIRAKVAFDEQHYWREANRLHNVERRDELERRWIAVGVQIENARLTPIIEKLLRVIECQDDAAEEAIARLGDFGDLYSSRPLRLAQAEVLRILEGS